MSAYLWGLKQTYRKIPKALQGRRGTDHWKARLNEQKVKLIRAWHSAQGMTQTEMARRMGVCKQAIHYVVSGKTWGWLA